MGWVRSLPFRFVLRFFSLQAIKLTSVKTHIPYEYYTLPFCKPQQGELTYKSENLGEVLRGDRIVDTPFQVRPNLYKQTILVRSRFLHHISLLF